MKKKIKDLTLNEIDENFCMKRGYDECKTCPLFVRKTSPSKCKMDYEEYQEKEVEIDVKENNLESSHLLEEENKNKKALEIIKNKRVNVDLLLSSRDVEYYNSMFADEPGLELTKEEYELLKEVLDNVDR